MTISQKKQGMNIKDIQCSDTKKTIPTPKPKQIIKEVIKEVVKEVRVYNNQTDTEMTIQEIPLSECKKWVIDGDKIYHESKEFFSILGFLCLNFFWFCYILYLSKILVFYL